HWSRGLVEKPTFWPRSVDLSPVRRKAGDWSLHASISDWSFPVLQTLASVCGPRGKSSDAWTASSRAPRRWGWLWVNRRPVSASARDISLSGHLTPRYRHHLSRLPGCHVYRASGARLVTSGLGPISGWIGLKAVRKRVEGLIRKPHPSCRQRRKAWTTHRSLMPCF